MKWLGLLILLAGGGGFVLSAPKLDEYRTVLGRLAQGLDPAAADAAQSWQLVYYGSIAAMVIGGVLFLGGLLAGGRRRRR